MNRRIFLGTLALAGVLFQPNHAARAAEQQKRPKASPEVWSRTELYFGAQKPDNTEVSDFDFQQFVDNSITPRFPDGLTLLTGRGQFRNSQGQLVRETSRVLVLLYPPQLREANKNIQDIREEYKSAFSQESVLRVDSFSLVSF